MARFSIFAPVVVSLLVPVWLLLSKFLGYDILFAPDPMTPRYDATWLGVAFYIVWWPLLAVFIIPGLFVCRPIIHFIPQGFLRFAIPGVVGGVVYTLILSGLYLLFRRVFRHGKQ